MRCFSTVGLSLFVILLNFPTVSTQQLIFTHVLYRHGDRSPSRTFPTDPHQTDPWPQGWSQLTQLGMKQSHELGVFLKNRYVPGLVSANYTRSEIYVRSSDKDRAIQTGQAVLSGLYPPSGSQIWNEDIKWQPVPIHTFMPYKKDLLLKPTSVDCPNYDKTYEEDTRKILDKYNNEYAEFFTFLKNKTGLKDLKFDNIGDVHTVIFRQRANNLQLPSWADENWKNTGKTVYELIVELKRVQRITQFDSSEESRLIGGYLLGDIIEKTNQKASDTLDKPSKIIMYSSHDGTVTSLLYAMGVGNDLLLPYTSCVMIELYKDKDEMYYVQVYLRNETNHEPYLLHVPECPEENYCPLGTFSRVLETRSFKNKDARSQSCGITERKKLASSSGHAVAIIILTFICLLLIVIIVILGIKLRNTNLGMRVDGNQLRHSAI